MRLRRLRDTGDTIIEVLVCLAVLGFMLTLAYSIATRAQQTIQSAHERSRALKLAEGQIEQMKAIAKNSPAEIFTNRSTGAFCLVNGVAKDFAPAAPTPGLGAWSYNPACTNVDGLYKVSILTPGVAGLSYVVQIRWVHINGVGEDEVKLEYKLYPEN